MYSYDNMPLLVINHYRHNGTLRDFRLPCRCEMVVCNKVLTNYHSMEQKISEALRFLDGTYKIRVLG